MPNQPQEGLERAMGEAKKQASHVADGANTAARRTANSFETAARELIENQPYKAVGITAQLIRLVSSDGSLIFIGNPAHGSQETQTGKETQSPLFSHPFDFKNSYYYVRVDISRNDPTAFAKLFGVSLDCETCPAD
jgi:hypothetical protein